MPGAGLGVPGQLLVEGGVAVTEQDNEGPDAEGGSEGEAQEAEEGGNDSYDAAPLGALVQAPSRDQGQTGTNQEGDPDKMEDCRTEPAGRKRAVTPRAMIPVAKVVEKKGVGK